jgi:hypothetical protein
MRLRVFLVLCGLVALAVWAAGVDAYVNEEAVLGTALIFVGGLLIVALVSVLQRHRRGETLGAIVEAIFEFFQYR